MLPKDGEDYEYGEPVGREVDIGGGLCTNAPSAFLDENADHVINWKDETVVSEYVNQIYKKTQAVLNSAAEANDWSDAEIEETIDDVIKLSKGVYQKYVLTEISEYISRPEEDIIKFISNFIIRWDLPYLIITDSLGK